MQKLRRACLVSVSLALVHCGGEPHGQPTASATAPPAASSPLASAAPPAAEVPAVSAVAPPAGPERPLYYEVAVTRADVDGRTLRELSLMRNWIYARAGNPFRKPWLDEFFRSKDWYSPKEKMDASKISKLDKENARAIAEHEAALTKEELEKRRDEVLARKAKGPLLKEDEIELALLSQRLGTWLGGEGEDAATPLADPSKLDKLLTVEELSTLSRRDLRMLRNTIYARRGRPFDSKVVKSFFETATWYVPNPSYDDSMLTEIDRKNIGIVRSVEDSLGGPEHENPEYGKDGWFVAA